MTSHPFPPTRMWGAVWTEDGPVAEVRDITTREDFNAILDGDDFRVFEFCHLDSLHPMKGHSKGGCTPEKPCKRCCDKAPGWWFEHGRRSKERHYKPAMESARIRGGYDMREYGPLAHSLDLARSSARLLGMPLVKVTDGHGRLVEWVEMSRA